MHFLGLYPLPPLHFDKIALARNASIESSIHSTSSALLPVSHCLHPFSQIPFDVNLFLCSLSFQAQTVSYCIFDLSSSIPCQDFRYKRYLLTATTQSP